jgi:hypothetical protein
LRDPPSRARSAGPRYRLGRTRRRRRHARTDREGSESPDRRTSQSAGESIGCDWPGVPRYGARRGHRPRTRQSDVTHAPSWDGTAGLCVPYATSRGQDPLERVRRWRAQVQLCARLLEQRAASCPTRRRRSDGSAIDARLSCALRTQHTATAEKSPRLCRGAEIQAEGDGPLFDCS